MTKMLLPFSGAEINIFDDDVEIGDLVRDYINERLCIALESHYAEIDRQIMNGDGSSPYLNLLNSLPQPTFHQMLDKWRGVDFDAHSEYPTISQHLSK